MNGPMTPREAADVIERTASWTATEFGFRHALRVLVDHARATSPAPEGGDLAGRVHRMLTMTGSSWDGHAYEIEHEDPDGASAWRSAAAELRELRKRFAAEPVPSVATPPQGGGDRSAHMFGIVDLSTPAAPPAEGEATS